MKNANELVTTFLEEMDDKDLDDAFTGGDERTLALMIEEYFVKKTKEIEADITEFSDEEIIMEASDRASDGDFKATLYSALDAPEILLDERPPLLRQMKLEWLESRMIIL